MGGYIPGPWGTTSISQTRGVRQGSIESPFLFSMCMEAALLAAQSDAAWPVGTGIMEGHPMPELLFMDDGVLQAWSRPDLELKAKLLIRELAKWGLELNPEKCTYYRSPYAKEDGPLRVHTHLLQPAPSLQMMGISLTVPLRMADLPRPAIQKARRKYFALRHLLESKTSLKERLKLFEKTVTAAATWCASIMPPNTNTLQEMNSAQLELVARMLGNKRRDGEDWLTQRMRVYRDARAMLQYHGHKRWSTTWLERRWTYLGHTSRAWHWESPPASAHYSRYRNLSWWRAEQSTITGIRHGARYYPAMMNEEQRLNTASGGVDWRVVATDRQAWAQRMSQWLQQEDVAWTSRRQLALTPP